MVVHIKYIWICDNKFEYFKGKATLKFEDNNPSL